MNFFLPSGLIFAIIDRAMAVGLGVSAATVGLLVRSGFYAGKRIYYGKELTTDEKVLKEIKRLVEIAELLEERERALEIKENKLEQAITALIKHDYTGITKELENNNVN